MTSSPSLTRILIVGFMGALLFYIAGFSLDTYLRGRRGPWEVTFVAEPVGRPFISVRQPALGIEGVRIEFEGHSTSPTNRTVRFGIPHLEVPFGRVSYDDLSYLPGAVTLDLFGHEIELLPRTLYIDRVAIPWVVRTNLVLGGE